MKKTRVNYQNTLFIVTIIFFALGIVNISFAAVGILCFIIPLVQYAVNKEKLWCKYYCPRAGFFVRALSKISLNKKKPKFITGAKLKKAVLIYFTINLFFILMSTVMVGFVGMAPMEHIRFLIAIALPINLPQLVNVAAPDFLIHFGYRMYSVMFTSTVIGLVLGFIYTPRTWCIFCPIQTITTPKQKKLNN